MILGILAIALGWLAGSGSGQAEEKPELQGELLKVEGKKDADRFQVLITVDNPVTYKSFALTSPHRLVINLTPCRKGASKIQDISGGPVQRLRSSQFNDDTVRIVLDLERQASYTLSPQAGDPFRLMVTISGEKELKPANEDPGPKTKKGPIGEKARETGVRTTLSVPPEEGKKPKAGGPGAEIPGINNRQTAGQSAEQADLTRQIEKVFEKGDYREVLRLYGLHQESLRAGADPGLLQQVGNSYKALGFYDPAVRTFQAAWQGGAQGAPSLVLDWAEALAGKGKVAEAVSLIQTQVERPAGSRDQQVRAVRLMVLCLSQQRLYAEALRTLEAGGRRIPRWDQDPEYKYLLGLVCFEIPGLGSKSLSALRQFVAVNQDTVRTASAYEKIGDLCFENKQYEEAWRAYYQAWRIQPAAKGTFLAKKLTQCRLLVEERSSGSAPGNGAAETDPFWKKLHEHRTAQQKLEKKVNELRLN